jgi:hypothetical protein
MSELPDGLDDNAMVAAIAWEIVDYAYLKTSILRERPAEEIMTKLTNEFIRARGAIYHGKAFPEPGKE